MDKNNVTRNEFNLGMSKANKETIIYDISRKPLGISGGIRGGKEVVSDESRVIDFSPYKRVEVYCSCAGIFFRYVIDLMQESDRSDFGEYVYSGSGESHAVDDLLSGSESMGVYYSWSRINKDKNKFIHSATGFTLGQQVQSRNDNPSYFIYRIVGIN